MRGDMEKIGTGKVLTLGGMVASSIVFIFTTFETKGDAEEKQKAEAKVMQVTVDGLNQKMDLLNQNIRDNQQEVMNRFDKLDKGRSRR